MSTLDRQWKAMQKQLAALSAARVHLPPEAHRNEVNTTYKSAFK